MCQLLGISAPRPIPVRAYLEEFYSHSHQHPHGWGLALFDGSNQNLEKEPIPAWQSLYLKNRLSALPEAANLIAHIRQASRGGLSYHNCHPFVHRDSDGRQWALAHNGTIFEGSCTDPFRQVQTGSTDSERILFYLLACLEQQRKHSPHPLSPEARFSVLSPAVNRLAEGNKLNLLFYDGEYLYVHTNKPGTLYFRQDHDALFFCTVPLGNESEAWQQVPLCRLLAFRDGQPAFTGAVHPHLHTAPDPQPLDLEYALL